MSGHAHLVSQDGEYVRRVSASSVRNSFKFTAQSLIGHFQLGMRGVNLERQIQHRIVGIDRVFAPHSASVKSPSRSDFDLMLNALPPRTSAFRAVE